jgi:hypothetical protein
MENKDDGIRMYVIDVANAFVVALQQTLED